jgi:hypothetical protein
MLKLPKCYESKLPYRRRFDASIKLTNPACSGIKKTEPTGPQADEIRTESTAPDPVLHADNSSNNAS